MIQAPQANGKAAQKLRAYIPGVAASLLILISAAGFLDWATHYVGLPRQLPGLATLKANSALGFLALGLSILLLTKNNLQQKRWRNRIALALSSLILLLTLLTLAEWTLNISFGVDELLVLDPNTLAKDHPGRMAPATALVSACSAAALAFLVRSRRADEIDAESVKIAHAFAVPPALIGYLSISGYAFGVSGLYSFSPFSSVSPFSALNFVLLALGILFTDPELGWLAPFVERPVARRALSRLLLFALLGPALTGAAVVFGAHAHLYAPAFIPSLCALATAGLVAMVSLFAANVVRDAEGKLIELERALRISDRRKDEFLATLAHELRNPLAPIRSGLYVLKFSGKDSSEADRLLPIMERQIDHLVRLVDDLLEVSRISHGKIKLKKEPCDFAAVLRDAIALNDPHIHAKNLHLSVELPSAPAIVDGDALRLTQAFTNLLDNAAKFTDEGGHIWLQSARSQNEIRVSVRDDGKGISPDLLPRVFDLFAQGGDDQGGARRGLGIGLALAQRLVQKHGGEIEARSGGLGQGSEFIVRLPFDPALATATEKERTHHELADAPAAPSDSILPQPLK